MNHHNSGVDGERESRRSHLPKFRKAAASIALFASAASLANGKPVENHGDELPKNSVILRSDSLNFSVPEVVSGPARIIESEADREALGYCKIVDIPLPSQLSYAEIAKGAQTEFAVSTEQYEQLSEQLKNSNTITEAQAVIDAELEGLGVDARFDAPMTGVYEPVLGKIDEHELEYYKAGMQVFIEALSLVPREALRHDKSVNFLNASHLINPDRKDMRFAGLYAGGREEITLPVRGINVQVVVHEIMHSLHKAACGNDDDFELQDQYNEMLELYSKLHPLNEEVDKKIGFPTTYSRENDRELFADLATDIITRGSFVSRDSNEFKTAERLRKMIVDRLQKALPGTDVNGYLQYMDAYAKNTPDMVSPRELEERHVSPFDATYAGFKDAEQGEIVPAIVIPGENGTPDQYIYAHIEKTEYMTAVDIAVHYMPNMTDASKQALEDAVHSYLDGLQLKGTRDLNEVSSVVDEKFPDQFKLEVFKPKLLQYLDSRR